jgi:hypothetical protein
MAGTPSASWDWARQQVGGSQPVGTAEAIAALGGGGGSSYVSPEVLTYIANMTGIGYDAATAMEALKYQKTRDDADRQFNYWSAKEAEDGANERARIAAGASAAAAASGSAADMYAADQDLKAAQEMAAASRYAADQALAGLKISEENKIKIAAANLNLESKRIAAEEMGAPSAWRTQAGYLRSQGMTQADITPGAIQQAGQALGPVAPELAISTTPAPTAPAPMAAPQLPQAAQQAVVGEAGPELATATAQGTQIQPIQRESAWWLRKQGAPQMGRGGIVGAVGGRTYLPNPTGAVRSQFLDPSQMYASMVSLINPKASLEERAAREQGAMAFAGGTPQIARLGQTTGGGQTLSPGGVGAGSTTTGGAAGSTSTTPVAGEGTTEGEPPYLEMLRTGANVPLWEAWGGPRTKPEVGMNIPIKMPHEINYGDFVRLTPTEQQMAFADWQALGMAPDTALRIMQASAMRGTAQAATAYG